MKTIVLTSPSGLTKLVYVGRPSRPIYRTKHERDDTHREEWARVSACVGMFKDKANSEITQRLAEGWKRA